MNLEDLGLVLIPVDPAIMTVKTIRDFRAALAVYVDPVDHIVTTRGVVALKAHERRVTDAVSTAIFTMFSARS